MDPDTLKAGARAAWALGVMRGEAGDPERMGVMSAAELSEGDYGLPEMARKGLGALASTAIDPSQRRRILRATLHESPLDGLLEKRCGFGKAALNDAQAGKSVGEVVSKCKVDDATLHGIAKDALDPLAVLAAVAILQALNARGETTPSEKSLASYLIELKLPQP